MKFKVGRLGTSFFLVALIFANFPPDTGLASNLKGFDAQLSQMLYSLAFVCWAWVVLDVAWRMGDWLSKEDEAADVKTEQGTFEQ